MPITVHFQVPILLRRAYIALVAYLGGVWGGPSGQIRINKE